MDKKRVANFSRYAKLYDVYADIQRACGIHLLQKIGSPEDVLEIGCGTGFYTSLIKDRVSRTMVALDISEEMLKIAIDRLRGSKVLFVLADGEAVPLKKRFDLITSNAVFQWFDQLKEALFQYKGILKRGGRLLFSIFGKETFWELKSLLNIEETNSVTEERLKKALIPFSRVSLEEKRFCREYPSLSVLLDKIRYSGEGIRREKGLWTKRRIEETERLYLEKFGKIIATYQVFFCEVG